MACKIACIGDIHLGRRPGRLPETLSDHGVNISDLTPAVAWSDAVQWAIDSSVDAVVLTGDLVENEEDRFEAFYHLVAGIEKLFLEKIQVIMVAGNHDCKALPRLVNMIPKVRLLGEKGVWELAEIDLRNNEKIRFLGWSFPERRYSKNPIASLDMDQLKSQSGSSCPIIGLLHCDLDLKSSPYAPVTSDDLMHKPVDCWLLGHIHKPEKLSRARPTVRLGSLIGLDPGEPGPHGPWLAEIRGPKDISLNHIPLARLRWEKEDIHIDKIETPDKDDLEDLFVAEVFRAFDRIHSRINDGSLYAKVVGCRLKLKGRSKSHREIRRALSSKRFPAINKDGVHYFVEKIIDEGRTALDLESIARNNDPPGLLAKRLIAIEQKNSLGKTIIHDASIDLKRYSGGPTWDMLDEVEDSVSGILLNAGHEALEELLAQTRNDEE